jgi:heat shock protein HtpX
MGTPAAHGRELVRSRSLAVRMAILIVTIPVFVLAAVAAVVIFLPRHWLVVLVIGVAIGGLYRFFKHFDQRSKPRNDHVLEPEEDPELFAIVDRLCALVDIARPEIIASELRQPNSWVLHRPGSTPRLFITRSLRELLTPEELQAVVGHELTHIANRDALVMTIVGTPGSLLLDIRGGSIDGLLFVLVGALSRLGTATLSRYREFAADAGSAAITGRPSALASALLKVSGSQGGIPEKDLRTAAALNVFNLVAVAPPKQRRRAKVGPIARAARTHPDLDRRVEALHRLEARPHALRR